MDRVVFCVDSYGGTATKWLAACFNAHPQVACAHSFFWPPALPRLAGDDVPEVEVWRRENVYDVNEFFARLMALAPDKRCLGTVHAFAVNAGGSWRGDAELRLGYLLRHPVLQIESIVAHWAYRCSVDAPFRARTLASLADAERSFMASLVDLPPLVEAVAGGPDVEPALRAIAMIAVLESHRRPFVDVDVPVFTMERMTAERAYFADMYRYFTAGRADDADAVVARLFGTPALNRHRREPRAARDVFAAWPEWCRLLFHVSFYGHFGARYAALGYDLDFVPLVNAA